MSKHGVSDGSDDESSNNDEQQQQFGVINESVTDATPVNSGDEKEQPQEGVDDEAATCSTSAVALSSYPNTDVESTAQTPVTSLADASKKFSSKVVEAFEIEMGRTAGEMSEDELDELVKHGTTTTGSIRSSTDRRALVLAPSEEEPDDMESLLCGTETRNSKTTKAETASKISALYCLPCCDGGREPEHRMGNIRIVFPRVYTRTGGWGVLGPHWFGPLFVIGIILFASYYFIYECSWKKNLYMTAATCSLLALTTFYHLVNSAYRDPGVIVQGRLTLPDPIPRTYRWCETCNYYQPPSAAHCPDCDVCIAGFDHHCVWMSICIGVGNFKVRIFR